MEALALSAKPEVTAMGMVAAVLFLVLLLGLVVLAERSLKRHRGYGLKRGRSERNAMSRVIVGLARWGGGSGGGGGGS